MKKTLAMIFLAGAMLISACSPKAVEPTPASSVSESQGIIAEGRLYPVNWLDQSFAVPGQVAQVLVNAGNSVSSGQELARLVDSPEAYNALMRAEQEALAAQQALDELASNAETALAQAEIAYLKAKSDLEKARDRFEADESDENKANLDAARAGSNLAESTLSNLKSGNGIDPAQNAAAQARLSAARAAVASAQASLDSLTLKSSLTGTVVDLALQPGERVAAGTPVMTVVDFSKWLVKTDNLTEIDVVGIRTGQEVSVVLDALPDASLTGRVTQINARYEEKRGDITYTVTIELDKVDPEFRWGMTAAVHFNS